jgi:8-oxo-dGTP pyrophosphatase MutT (NUDIX family)
MEEKENDPSGEKWEVIDSKLVVDHPFMEVAMEKVSLPDGRIISDWPIVNARDYVNVVVFNGLGQALILEGYKHGARRSSWQVVGGYLEPDEDPLSAAQRELLEEAGHHSEQWRYLGSFIVDANRHVGTGHFFLCLDAREIAAPTPDDLEPFSLRWVSLKELKYALMDGRISVISYAMNVSLALVALNKLSQNQVLTYLLAQSD